MIRDMGRKAKRDDSLRQNLGKRIKELRKEKGFTQERFAEAVDLHPSFIAQIEAGVRLPSIDTLVRMAGKLNVPVYRMWLFEPEVSIKEQSLQELIDLLKSGNADELKFLLTMAREHRKSYGQKTPN